MSFSQFISDYMIECVKQDISDPESICKKAKEEIEQIDNKLQDLDVLRIRKLNLNQLLVYFGEKQKRNILNMQTDLTDDNVDFLALQENICKIIEEFGAVTNREIIQMAGKYQEDLKVIHAIKRLGEKQCIARDGSSENKIIKGPNWELRPSKPASV